MSLLPQISSGRKKEDPSGTFRPRPKETLSREELALPGIHGNEDSNNKRGLSTATLQGSRLLHTPPRGKTQFPSRKMKRSPFKPCQFCGREFGSASIAIHRKQCQEKLLLKHSKGLVPQKTQCARGQVSLKARPNFGGAILNECDTNHEFKAATAAQGRKADPLLQQTCQPFSCACQFCGEKYGKHSVIIHEKQCLQKKRLPPSQEVQEKRCSSHAQPRRRAHGHYSEKGAVSRSLDGSISLNNPRELVLLPERPKTRTLDRSSLRNPTSIPERPKTRTLDRCSLPTNEYEVPSIGNIITPSTAVCDVCGHDVPSDRISVHQRTCKAPKHRVNTGPLSLTFPTLHHMTVRADSSHIRASTAGDSEVETRKIRKPPTVVCYVCGREYGTKSISIHEPQCLKKWRISNSKLPISHRKPVPKKPSSKTRAVQVAILAGEDVRVSGGYSQQPPEEVIERYFQHCYAEFEDELIPCAKCGRTFAPERHVKHTRNCNAEPLRR